MKQNEVVILDTVRTPIGKFRGALSRVRPDDLAGQALAALNARLPQAAADVTEVVMGAANQAGEDNRNVARMALLLAGMPYEVTGVTVNRLCASGLEAIVQASRAIALGDHQVMIAAGVESMTRAPWVMSKPDAPYSPTPPKVFDTSLGWRFENAKMAERFDLVAMGETAERVAEKYDVSRADQDAFAAESHRRAVAAWEAGKFARDVVPVTVPGATAKDAATQFVRDEGPRSDSTTESLARLKPVFRKDGTVTAGNASSLNDGASALMLASRAYADRMGIKPLARVVSMGVAGVHPSYMGIGPVPAAQQALAKAGLTVADLGAVELNEAFAAQALACVRELKLSQDIVNIYGGAIALGHPLGCSGARITSTLMTAMQERDARYGMAALCIGVGQGLAVIYERIA